MVYLEKALALYEHSHQMLTKEAIRAVFPAVHSMALASNLGQTHLALGHRREAEACMQYLLSTMMCVVYYSGMTKVDEEVDGALGDSVMDGFFGMVKPLISRDDPAPAA